MSDPREILTEETPESPEDFKKRQLTEVGGAVQHDPRQMLLFEDDPDEEKDKQTPQTLMG